MNDVLFVITEFQQLPVEGYFVKYVNDGTFWNVFFLHKAKIMWFVQCISIALHFIDDDVDYSLAIHGIDGNSHNLDCGESVYLNVCIQLQLIVLVIYFMNIYTFILFNIVLVV